MSKFVKERAGVYTDGSGWTVHRMAAGEWQLRLFNVYGGTYPSMRAAINEARRADR